MNVETTNGDAISRIAALIFTDLRLPDYCLEVLAPADCLNIREVANSLQMKTTGLGNRSGEFTGR